MSDDTGVPDDTASDTGDSGETGDSNDSDDPDTNDDSDTSDDSDADDTDDTDLVNDTDTDVPDTEDDGRDTDTDADTGDTEDTDIEPDICPVALAVVDDGTSSISLPDLVISEIDPGAHIELFNTTGAAITLANVAHHFCSRPEYQSLASLAPSVVVPAGGYATVPWPTTFQDADSGGEIVLFANDAFETDEAILDFVCWGNNPHSTRKDQAIDIGKWSGACAGALANGAIHRKVSTTGTTAADYDTERVADPKNCTP